MISSNSLKILLLVLSVLMLNASCSYFQKNNDINKIQDSESEIQTNIPFSTKEPETFQAEIVVSTFINDEKSERKYFLAKDENKSLHTFNAKTDNARSILRLEDETYLINNKPKTYRKKSKEKSVYLMDDSLIKSLTSKWLNEKKPASFEKLATENGLIKYRVKLGTEKNSFILMFIDEKLKMPVKQEFYSVVKDKDVLHYAIEMKNFKTEVEEDLFKLPENYKELD